MSIVRTPVLLALLIPIAAGSLVACSSTGGSTDLTPGAGGEVETLSVWPMTSPRYAVPGTDTRSAVATVVVPHAELPTFDLPFATTIDGGQIPFSSLPIPRDNALPERREIAPEEMSSMPSTERDLRLMMEWERQLVGLLQTIMGPNGWSRPGCGAWLAEDGLEIRLPGTGTDRATKLLRAMREADAGRVTINLRMRLILVEPARMAALPTWFPLSDRAAGGHVLTDVRSALRWADAARRDLHGEDGDQMEGPSDIAISAQPGRVARLQLLNQRSYVRFFEPADGASFANPFTGTGAASPMVDVDERGLQMVMRAVPSQLPNENSRGSVALGFGMEISSLSEMAELPLAGTVTPAQYPIGDRLKQEAIVEIPVGQSLIHLLPETLVRNADGGPARFMVLVITPELSTVEASNP